MVLQAIFSHNKGIKLENSQCESFFVFFLFIQQAKSFDASAICHVACQPATCAAHRDQQRADASRKSAIPTINRCQNMAALKFIAKSMFTKPNLFINYHSLINSTHDVFFLLLLLLFFEQQ